MNFNLYLFGNPNGKYDQIPNDYMASDIAPFLKDFKSSRLVIVRKMNLMHYIYVEKLDNTRFIGFCLIFNHVYISHPKQLVVTLRDLIEDYLIKKGDIIRYTKDGELQYAINSFSDNTLRYQKLHALLKDRFTTESAKYGILELKTIFNGERSSRTVGYNIGEEQLVLMSMSYNTLIIDDSEGIEQAYIPQVINGLNKNIQRLTKQNADLQKQIEKLNRQKKQMKWVLFLLIVLFTVGIVFYSYAQEKKQVIQDQSAQILDLNDTIDNKNLTIISLDAYINRLKSDSTNLSHSLNNRTNQLNDAKQKLNKLHFELEYNVPAYIYFPAWKSTNYHVASSSSSKEYTFYAYNGDILHIPYYVSSESGCDYLTITLYFNGKTEKILSKSGSYSNAVKEYTCSYSGTYRMVVQYSKDGSVDKNYDNAGVKQFYIYRPIVDRLRRMAEYKE